MKEGEKERRMRMMRRRGRKEREGGGDGGGNPELPSHQNCCNCSSFFHSTW